MGNSWQGCGLLLTLTYELNSSPIDELGSWCPKGWWSWAMILAQGRRYLSQPCERPPPRHCHTNPVSGILTDTQYLPEGGGGGEWERKAPKISARDHKRPEKQASKQAKCTRCPCWAERPPRAVLKGTTAGQHCLKFNLA